MSKGFLAVMASIVVISAAVVLPSLRRARSAAGVQGGLGEVRTFLSAERAYASANQGYFDRPPCLAAPAACLPNYPRAGVAFVDDKLGRLAPTMGYWFQFHAGPAAPLDKAGNASKTSVTAFAFVAVPLPESGQRRAFCGDASDRICVRQDGTMPEVRDGRCPDACETMR